MAGLEVTLKSSTANDRLDKVILETLFEDVETVLRYVAVNEIAGQRALGNPATSLLVDGRGGKPIDTAQRRVQAFFANTDDLRKAVYEAWDLVQNTTRRRSGRAASSYQLWFKESSIGNSPAGVETALRNFNPATDYFRIVGPMLIYGRKVYWNPVGKARFVRKAIRIKTQSAQFVIGVRRIRGVMNLVEQAMKRRYRNLAITEDWVVTSALPSDGRTPGLWLGFKRRGTLLAPGAANG